MSFGPDLGLVLFATTDKNGTDGVRGYVHYGPDLPPKEIVAATIDTDYDERTYARSARVHLQTADGEEMDIEGEAWSTIPLRHRKDGLTARLTEGMATWRTGDRTGVGLLEYFDKMIDGVRVGP
jgi:hypothetical protein